jgi:hypothetical protein
MYALHDQSQWQHLHPYRLLRKPGRAAQLTRSVKETKYKARPHVMPMDSSYYHFVLSLLVLAGASKACDDFFKKILKDNSKGNESVYRASSNYWLSRLSCCLQKSIAVSIVNRSKLINGDMLHNLDYQFDEDFILESGFRLVPQFSLLV